MVGGYMCHAFAIIGVACDTDVMRKCLFKLAAAAHTNSTQPANHMQCVEVLTTLSLAVYLDQATIPPSCQKLESYAVVSMVAS